MIPPISPLPPPSSAGAGAGAGTGATPAAAGGAGASGGFAQSVTNALQQVQQVQNTASNQAVQVAAGQGNIASAMMATTEASLVTQVTTAVANKAIAAFTDIMNLQI